jgi:hypothetical protein
LIAPFGPKPPAEHGRAQQPGRGHFYANALLAYAKNQLLHRCGLTETKEHIELPFPSMHWN